MAFVPYNFPGSFPDDFVSRITGDGKHNGELGWDTDYSDVDPQNGIADFVDAYCSGDPDLTIKVSQDHAGDRGHVRYEPKP